MALPLLALGKIVSGVVTGTAKGLTVAGKATVKGSKVVGRAAKKAARAGAELAYEAGSAAKPRLIKGVKATTKELKKIASATQKSMSNFGKRMSNRKTGTEKLKRDANKIKSNLTQDIKKIKKQRLDKERFERNVLERKEIRDMERNIKSSKTPTGKKVQSILKSPMNIIDKIFGLGGILLTGIVVNSIDDIVEKFKEFKENNQGLFDNIAKILTVIKDSFVYLFDEMTKPFGEEGALDGIAKFKDDGTIESGKLKELQDEIEKLGPVVDMFSRAKEKFDNSIFSSDYSARKNLESGKFTDPNFKFEKVNKETGDTEYLTMKEMHRRRYFVDQNGIVRLKKSGNPALGWNNDFIDVSDAKAYLEKKPYYEQISFSKINPDDFNNSVFNLDPDMSNSIIFAYQKEIEYVPISSGNDSGFDAINFDTPIGSDLSNIWKND